MIRFTSYIARRGQLLIWLLVAALVPFAARPTQVQAQSPLPCSGQFLIDHTFPNGGRWRLCWTDEALAGVSFYQVHFDPPGTATPERLILYSTALSQIHVPYDDNGARFHDVSDYGMGNNRQWLTAAECPGGTLIPLDTDPATNDFRVCRTQTGEGHAFRYYGTHKQASALTLLNASAIGQYNYIPRWTFYDDGTIEVGIGATGRLQRHTTNASYGWLINASSLPRGVSHTHNYWWRFDFALNGDSNDQLQEVNINGSGSDLRPMSISSLGTEAARTVSQSAFRWWRIRDTALTNNEGHAISYEIEPNASRVFRGPSYEPWTNAELYYTQYNGCERYASHNAVACSGAPSNASAFVNGQAVTDAVVFYGHTFHHVARDEDELYMSSHWDSFKLVPRDMTGTNPR